MDDLPLEHKTNATFQLYGHVYNADRQCNFIFGEGYGKCSFREVNYCLLIFIGIFQWGFELVSKL